MPVSYSGSPQDLLRIPCGSPLQLEHIPYTRRIVNPPQGIPYSVTPALNRTADAYNPRMVEAIIEVVVVVVGGGGGEGWMTTRGIPRLLTIASRGLAREQQVIS